MKQFVQNREGASSQMHLAKRSLTPQPKTHRDRTVQPQEDAGPRPRAGSQDGRDRNNTNRQEAAKLKLPVPNTIGKLPSNNLHIAEHDVAEVEAAIAHHKSSRTVPHMQAPHQPIVSAFDDTQSIHFDDSTSIADDLDSQMDMDFDPRQRRNSSHPPRTSSVQQYNNLYEEQPAVSLQRAGRPAVGWQVMVDAERHRHGRPSKYGTQLDDGSLDYTSTDQRYDEGYDPEGEYAEGPGPLENTPSRTRGPLNPTPVRDLKKSIAKTGPRQPVPEEPPSPPLPTKRKPLSEVGLNEVAELPLHPHVNRFKTFKASDDNTFAEPSKETHSTLQAPQQGHPSNIQQPAFSSKESSYHESSSEEDQPLSTDSSNTTPSLKRSHHSRDLDFDPETLPTKTLADLDAIPFTVDPSAPPPQPALDANGNPMTLSAKLTNLTKMRPEDQRQLFKSQTDEEREQTATWFLEKFQSDMQKLMAVRLERRKIALKFELEVKKRERRVQVKRADVDRELEGLRRGGVELIGGKAPAK
ncbi:hypothetical protein A1O1_03459 [Capronia coronata CBS 617.96]|uniref:Extracellular mutant protein 11 C-terminal domain-containing protein n=1 Tax=Capronia coronata CBS 617.96 TaxID=1182541 RepID=W9YL37_9EURO|nr:uncharacterized protein A1O1_03459 [Capronia coronata CBS 617.96]EXJ90360.1 hypothetical protein A1O1_03459 [Capronia coronata CBS 617.96]